MIDSVINWAHANGGGWRWFIPRTMVMLLALAQPTKWSRIPAMLRLMREVE